MPFGLQGASAFIAHVDELPHTAIPGFVRGFTGFVPNGEEEADDVDCDWSEMQLGNNKSFWKPQKAIVKYKYDHDLEGQEIVHWWPGRADAGECNDVNDASRGCWYRSRMLNDPSCTIRKHCLHMAAADGEMSHTYTCPTWVRDKEHNRCRLPPYWQACPEKFELKRIDSINGPIDFNKARGQACGPGVTDHCLGSTKNELNTSMYFDPRRNQWYRCNEWLKCESFPIEHIPRKPGGKCGEASAKLVCGDAEYCFKHRPENASVKEFTYECVPDDSIFVMADGDDMVTSSIPMSIVMMLPFLTRNHLPLSRAQKAANFL